ncbi:MAG TPA: hypothetical protein VFU21_03495 [Kofleriaceae bacterium]|nr:hypothetical protein [Kofleriaceae bacterium]
MRAPLLVVAITAACAGDAGVEDSPPDASAPADARTISIDPIGCADGEREGFADAAMFPRIAACAGGFAVPGLRTTIAPACERAAGDDGALPDGAGCNAADLCSAGWHVCVGAAEVGARTAGSCAAAGDGFFVTRQSGPGGALCGDGANDLFGCGAVGQAVTDASCAPLDRFSFDLCSALPAPWSCGADGAAEADAVVKPGADAGGVLCCREEPL